jgi:hypothetical protein
LFILLQAYVEDGESSGYDPEVPRRGIDCIECLSFRFQEVVPNVSSERCVDIDDCSWDCEVSKCCIG